MQVDSWRCCDRTRQILLFCLNFHAGVCVSSGSKVLRLWQVAWRNLPAHTNLLCISDYNIWSLDVRHLRLISRLLLRETCLIFSPNFYSCQYPPMQGIDLSWKLPVKWSTTTFDFHASVCFMHTILTKCISAGAAVVQRRVRATFAPWFSTAITSHPAAAAYCLITVWAFFDIIANNALRKITSFTVLSRNTFQAELLCTHLTKVGLAPFLTKVSQAWVASMLLHAIAACINVVRNPWLASISLTALLIEILTCNTAKLATFQ